MVEEHTANDAEDKIAASTIDLYSLTPEELETLAQIAEKNQAKIEAKTQIDKARRDAEDQE